MNNEMSDNHNQTESTRIKLVIDISKEVYEDIKYNFNKQKYCSCGEYLISSMIVFGTPLEEELEKIKAEILSEFLDYESDVNLGLNLALNILYKYIKENE